MKQIFENGFVRKIFVIALIVFLVESGTLSAITGPIASVFAEEPSAAKDSWTTEQRKYVDMLNQYMDEALAERDKFKEERDALYKAAVNLEQALISTAKNRDELADYIIQGDECKLASRRIDL